MTLWSHTHYAFAYSIENCLSFDSLSNVETYVLMMAINFYKLNGYNWVSTRSFWEGNFIASKHNTRPLINSVQPGATIWQMVDVCRDLTKYICSNIWTIVRIITKVWNEQSYYNIRVAFISRQHQLVFRYWLQLSCSEVHCFKVPYTPIMLICNITQLLRFLEKTFKSYLVICIHRWDIQLSTCFAICIHQGWANCGSLRLWLRLFNDRTSISWFC